MVIIRESTATRDWDKNYEISALRHCVCKHSAALALLAVSFCSFLICCFALCLLTYILKEKAKEKNKKQPGIHSTIAPGDRGMYR